MSLYNSMSREIDAEFFILDKPAFDYDEMFTVVNKSYGSSVVLAIKQMATDNMEDAIKLANLVLADMKEVLARQRRDYGISEDYPEEYPVFDQAFNIDDTPVHTLAMER